MKNSFSLLLSACLFACGGADNSNLDGGGDATTEGGGADGGNKDGGPGGDGGGTDGGGADAGNDAATDAGKTDAGDAGSTTFACGSKTCDSATDYCEKTKTSLLDGGLKDAGTIDTCLAYPPSCTVDGGTPSCSCITTTGCTCTQNGSDITVTCP